MADEASTGGVKRKRGGQRQRLARAAAEDAAPETDSKLSEYLLDQVAWGYMSPQQVQQIADLAHCDVQAALATERVPNNLVPLANAGTRGAHPNKCYADVMKAATKSSDVHVSNPVLVSLPFRKPVGERLQAVLLPHQLFSDIYHHHPATWEQCILGQPGDLERFWELTSGHPAVTPGMKARRDLTHRCIPLSLHGDGAPLVSRGKAWQQQMTDFSWYSLLGRGNTGDLLYLIWGMFDKLCLGDQEPESTLGSFFALLKWSFEALWRGKWPDRDHLGVKTLGCTAQSETKVYMKGSALKGFDFFLVEFRGFKYRFFHFF